MTTPTDDNRDLITFFAVMRAKEGREDELRQVLMTMTEASHDDEGYVNYDLHQGTEDPRVFCFYENWTTPELQAKHADAPHVQAFVSRMDDLVEGGADGLTLHRVQRIA
jgi:quinol monooxygenase YgiN